MDTINRTLAHIFIKLADAVDWLLVCPLVRVSRYFHNKVPVKEQPRTALDAFMAFVQTVDSLEPNPKMVEAHRKSRSLFGEQIKKTDIH